MAQNWAMSRDEDLTAQMSGALQWIASRGEMRVGRENAFVRDEISARTAGALERRGLVERRWTGAQDGYVYITAAGRALADLSLLDEPGDEGE